jgi:lantibiotic biosynthesis protein
MSREQCIVPRTPSPPANVDTEALLRRMVDRIAENIILQARWDGNVCQWPITVADPAAPGESRPIQEMTGGSIYQGTAGIALFLTEHARRTGNPDSARTARGALEYARREAARVGDCRLGFYSGLLGVAYAHLRFAEVSDRERYEIIGQEMLESIACAAAVDSWLDVIGGGAGAIPVLLWAAQKLESARWVDLATRIGEALIKCALSDCDGWSWGAPRLSHERNLVGFAHGAAGFGWAFLELYAATGQGRFRFASEQAFRYEAQFFDTNHRNWVDFRDSELSRLEISMSASDFRNLVRSGRVRPNVDRSKRSMLAWCHGAPGIGLARLRAFELTRDDDHRYFADQACSTTIEALLAQGRQSQCLCHGACGNAETLLRAATTLGRPQYESAVRTVAEEFATAVDQGATWRSGALGGALDPSLMLGDAGIGYFYLRLLFPETESVLLPGSDRRHSVDIDVDESYELEEAAYVQRFFGRTLRVLEARGQPITWRRSPSAVRTSVLHDVHTVVQRVVDESANPPDRLQLVDAWAPESRAYSLRVGGRTPRERLLDALCSTDLATIDWDRAVIQLAPATELVPAIWDWEAWLSAHGDEPLSRLPSGHSYIVTDRMDPAPWVRIGPFMSVVLREVGTPKSVADLGTLLRDDVAVEVADDQLRAKICDAVRLAHRIGVVLVTCPCPGDDAKGDARAAASVPTSRAQSASSCMSMPRVGGQATA